MKIIVDAMGGDNAPLEIVRGALDANRNHGVEIILVGRTAEVLKAVEACGQKSLPAGVEIKDAKEVVEIADDPAMAFKQKPDSSLTVGLNLLKDGAGDAFVSAGSTGALLSGATLVVKRIRGIRRAAMGPQIPTAGGRAVLCDCGANAECTPEYLLQFAYLGSYYAQRVMGIEKPRVGLLNIGAEEEKGDTLRHETYALLKEAGEVGRIHFIGNVEANEAMITERGSMVWMSPNMKMETGAGGIGKAFGRMFSGEYDSADCYLDIQAGSGGTEAQDWASMLMRMYLRWAEARGFKTEIIEESEGEVAGIKSVTIKIIGDYAYGWLRTETGVHRLVRKSPFDSGGRRHTSFSSAFVYPEVEDDIDIEINPADLRIDVYRASGAGGQHVNRTESAVRITHIPTGLVTQCQNDRSQHKNKDQAMKQMKAKLYELEMQKKNAEKQAMEDNKSDIGWGSQIRSYVLDDSRIKDLRTGVETRNTQAVLDGSLDQFIEASLKAGL